MNAGEALNCLSYWWPKIVPAAGIPMPKTVLVQADEHKLKKILDGPNRGDAAEFTRLEKAIARQVDGVEIKYPFFLRTGQHSGKHSWRKTCRVPDRDSLGKHIFELIELSEMMGFFGLPQNIWAVREMLPVQPLEYLERYHGMPLVREIRCFIDGGSIVCAHAYWPEAAIREGLACGHVPSAGSPAELFGFDSDNPCPDCDRRANELFLAAGADDRGWLPHALALARLFEKEGHAWSADFLSTERGWFLTDMAVAGDSFHYPGCPHGKRFPPSMPGLAAADEPAGPAPTLERKS